MGQSCVFCQDVLRDRKAWIIYENDLAAAFMDHAPVEEGHLLVVPRKHFQDIFTIDPEDYLAVHELAWKLAPLVVKVTGADGMNIGQNNGACANQVVFHYHLHIIPRFCNRKVSWERRKMSMEELENIASSLRAEVESVLE